MLAWENPYEDHDNELASVDSYSLQVYSLLSTKYLFLLKYLCFVYKDCFLNVKYRAG